MSPALTTKRLISKDGTEILAEATGDYSKPHIVFENMYMVRFDMRAHGRSGKPERPEDYESIRYAEDVQAVIDGFKLNKPILAGWSLGAGVLADVCAHLDPLPISAAIWIAPPGILRCSNRLAVTDCFLFWIGSAAMVPPACMGLVLSKRQDFASLKKYAARGLPLFFIYGAEDVLAECVNILDNTKPLFSDIEVAVMEGTGHIPFWEEPKVFAEHILRFVKRISP
ncbi:alpha/beta-hydrolase [Mycena rebaudengoi]|nr:alpha/beta-hydrolase [Mycena rebaudengoi]